MAETNTDADGPIEVGEALPAPAPIHYQIKTDADGVVASCIQSNVPQEGHFDVERELFFEALLKTGRCKYGNGKLTDYEPPAFDPVPQSVSDRQFFQQLAIEGVITEDEALATSDGTLPALMNAILDQLPDEQRFGARMKAKNATVYERNDPLVLTVAYFLNQMGTLGLWDAPRLDKFWRDASKL